MSNRMTDSNKWRDPWYRNLPPEVKLLWNYMLDECDRCGVWEIDMDLFNMLSKCSLSWNIAYNYLEARITVFDFQKKLWVKKFIEFQSQGNLSIKCIPHKSMIKCLESHGNGLFEQFKELFPTLWLGYTNPNNTLIEREEEGDIEKDKQKFEDARKIWPGSKKGFQTEFENFMDKYKKEKTKIIPLLFPAVEKAIKFRKECERVKASFTPSYKNFSTWINQRCWEEEFPTEVY